MKWRYKRTVFIIFNYVRLICFDFKERNENRKVDVGKLKLVLSDSR